jgi:hypothetical protein
MAQCCQEIPNEKLKLLYSKATYLFLLQINETRFIRSVLINELKRIEKQIREYDRTHKR